MLCVFAGLGVFAHLLFSAKTPGSAKPLNLSVSSDACYSHRDLRSRKALEMDFKLKTQVMDAAGISRALSRLASEIVERNVGTSDLLLVGIRRRGVPLAERIADKIEQL